MTTRPLEGLIPGALALLLCACGGAPQTPAATAPAKDLASVAVADATCRDGRELRPTGGDDTALLQAALDRCAPGGRDCAIRLGKGVFKTRQLAVTGFHGSLTGAGMHETVIEPYGILDVSQEPFFFMDAPAPSATVKWPVLLTFWKGADARVSNLTFRVTEPDPTHGWNCKVCDGPPYPTWLKATVLVAGSGRFEHVAFEGAAGTDDGVVNLDDGLVFGWVLPGPTAGVVGEVKGCRFSMTGNGMDISALTGARITIGGSPGEGNVFEHSTGGIFENLDASTVEYSHNRVFSDMPYDQGVGFLNMDGGLMWPMTLTAPTRFTVHHNQIAIGSVVMNGINAWDDFAGSRGVKSMEVAIHHNQIDVSGDAQDNSGVLAMYTMGDVITHNRITGAGYAGIDAYYTNACLIEHNDVGGFSAATAPILLDEGSHDCTAIVKDASSVLDLGTGNHVIVKH